MVLKQQTDPRTRSTAKVDAVEARNHPDRIRIAFDDRRLVANAGLLLPATLARHLGLGTRGSASDLGGPRARANFGLPRWPLCGLRAGWGATASLSRVSASGQGEGLHPGRTVKAPSTLGAVFLPADPLSTSANYATG